MKDKRLDELYNYIETRDSAWRMEHIKNYEMEYRIEKAIEYIENHIIATETEDTLLKILKGEDNNAI